jgi:hypothetical protein
MRENRQSGSEGREARQRAFLTPIGLMYRSVPTTNLFVPPGGPVSRRAGIAVAPPIGEIRCGAI